jgi:hypothetical protein
MKKLQTNLLGLSICAVGVFSLSVPSVANAQNGFCYQGGDPSNYCKWGDLPSPWCWSLSTGLIPSDIDADFDGSNGSVNGWYCS